MLTRLYIDNFRCFVKFEYRPARTQLILGANGTGKSSFMDALAFLHRFATQGESFVDTVNERTRWLKQLAQTFEIEATLNGSDYLYRVVLEPVSGRARVLSEAVQVDGKPALESGEEVRLYNDCFELKRSYQPDPYRWDRSALADVPPEHDLEKITRFKHWLGDLACFQVNPFAMSARAEVPQAGLAADLSNIAAWYWHSAALLRERAALIDNLRAVLDGFLDLVMLESIGGKVLAAEFVDEKGTKAIFRFNELSEGQRCLICLYAILHFVLAKGNTVVLDEPDNFVSLREIQPWLMAADDAVLDSGGQLLIISHHPEIINQWATSGGVRFVRDGIGPVRVEDFHSEPSYGLAPAELVARGWELG